jgi:SAM-dependent methyltransferase
MSNTNEEHPEIDLNQFYVIPKQEIHVTDFDALNDWVLDLGGGGEGIIGLMKGRSVIAIDKIGAELEETKNESIKIIMDMKELKFLDATFSTVTAFFAFMYVPEVDFKDILKEVWRVLKPGGKFLIWDPIFKIPPEEKNKKKRPVIFLTIHLPDGKIVDTGYGGWMRDQDINTILTPAEEVGFKVIDRREEDYTFYLKLQKVE